MSEHLRAFTTSQAAGDLLRTVVEGAAPRLAALGEAGSLRPRRPGAWTPRQILGHLIDSASNNHGRFVRAQGREDLVCDGYDQEAWVRVQDYEHAPWDELVALWRLYNLHLARVVAAIPPGEMTRPRARHNLDTIAWQQVPSTQPVTLAYFVTDYVGHLEHHLTQLLPGYVPVSFGSAVDARPPTR